MNRLLVLGLFLTGSAAVVDHPHLFRPSDSSRNRVATGFCSDPY